MIIDSKNETLNFILLRKGGDKIFIHKSIKKPYLFPIINSSRNQNSRNLFLNKPFLSDLSYIKKMNITRNSNNLEKDTTLKTKSIISETQKIDDSIFDTLINTNSNKKTRSLGTSYNFNDFSQNYNRSLNEIKNDKNNVINKAFFSFNNNLFNNNFLKYKSNILSFDSLKKPLVENMDNHVSKSIENPRIEKDIKSKEKKQFNFMKSLQNNKNFVINDYKSKKTSTNNISFNNISKINYYNDRSYNNKKRRAILIKDIAINSLLSEYEKNKVKLSKLTPYIIRNNYMKTKYGLNIKPEINNYELKIDINKNFKIPIKYQNYRSFFDLAKTYQ
jgi:hypothetical protein